MRVGARAPRLHQGSHRLQPLPGRGELPPWERQKASKKNEMKKCDFVRIAVLCDQLVLMQCWVRMRQSSNQL